MLAAVRFHHKFKCHKKKVRVKMKQSKHPSIAFCLQTRTPGTGATASLAIQSQSMSGWDCFQMLSKTRSGPSAVIFALWWPLRQSELDFSVMKYKVLRYTFPFPCDPWYLNTFGTVYRWVRSHLTSSSLHLFSFSALIILSVTPDWQRGTCIGPN